MPIFVSVIYHGAIYNFLKDTTSNNLYRYKRVTNVEQYRFPLNHQSQAAFGQVSALIGPFDRLALPLAHKLPLFHESEDVVVPFSECV
jgi:hypothetical protein